ncbi:MAG: tetratricopeptide repeat protein [Anaerolineales bacterium]|nr:tetratricopeptide repeat protein [Anaerolineales bacterium]
MTSPDISAEEAARTGQKHYREERWSEAAAAFQRAEQAYRDHGSKLDAAEMANNRAVALIQDDAPEKALEAIEGTPELFLEAQDEQRAAQAFGNRASALEALGRVQEATTAYQRAAELFNQLGDTDSRLHTYQAISRLQLRQGQTLEALTTYQRGLPGQGRLPWKQRLLRWLLSLPSRLLDS